MAEHEERERVAASEATRIDVEAEAQRLSELRTSAPAMLRTAQEQLEVGQQAFDRYNELNALFEDGPRDFAKSESIAPDSASSVVSAPAKPPS